jgi:hypothetical protein
MRFFCTASYKLPGDGLAEHDANNTESPSFDAGSTGMHFAPNNMTATSLQARLRQRLGQPLKIAVPEDGPVSQLTQACSVGFNSKSNLFKDTLLTAIFE